MPKQRVDKKNSHFKTQKFCLIYCFDIWNLYAFHWRNLAFSFFLKMSFLLVQQVPKGFRPVALDRFFPTITYDDWVNENLRDIKYVEE
jgi:hypothetical protein